MNLGNGLGKDERARHGRRARASERRAPAIFFLNPFRAVPAIVTTAGEDATRHFLNFFTAAVRNRHTRRAYARQALGFLHWCEARGCHELRAITTTHVSAYIEQLTRSELETASVKQALSSLRMLFAWLRCVFKLKA